MPSSQRLALVLQVVHTRQVVSQAAKRETVIPDPSYHLPAALAGISGLGVVSGNATLAGISGILAAFLAIQASRVKFVFGPESLVRSPCWHIRMRCIHRSCHIHRTCLHQRARRKACCESKCPAGRAMDCIFTSQPKVTSESTCWL